MHESFVPADEEPDLYIAIPAFDFSFPRIFTTEDKNNSDMGQFIMRHNEVLEPRAPNNAQACLLEP